MKNEYDKVKTGYASIDKPWLKYFSEEEISVEFEPMSMYQLMKKLNSPHPKDIAISYFGKKITYGHLICEIDVICRSLIKLGIKENDIVMMSLPNVPEAVVLFYAINKIGAVVCAVDPRKSNESILKDINETKCKYVFVIDVLFNKMSEILKECDIKAIYISAYESMPSPIKEIMLLKNRKKGIKESGNILWRDFKKLSKEYTGSIPEIFKPNELALIVYTGGSTGTPKGVMLSNESCNALAYQMLYSQIGFKRQGRFLNILPPFIALGIINATHVGACIGLESILIPSFEPEEFPNLVIKNKPNLIMAGPIHFNLLISSEKMKGVDLSFLEICVSGGDKMPKEVQERIQEFLKSHGAKANICIGYGATETSAGTSCMRNNCFRYESVGLPYNKNVMEVFDPDTNEKIKGYGNIGELRVTAPTLMLGYFGSNSVETETVIWTDSDGVKWYCTGDLGHFDEDGFVYIDGRIKRIITRRGFKIYPLYIEELILKHPYVKACAVVGVPDPDEISIPVANIVLYSENSSDNCKQEVMEYVQKTILEELPDYSVMAGFNFLDEMPVTPIGKLDFKKLESLGIMSNEKISQKVFAI